MKKTIILTILGLGLLSSLCDAQGKPVHFKHVDTVTIYKKYTYAPVDDTTFGIKNGGTNTDVNAFYVGKIKRIDTISIPIKDKRMIDKVMGIFENGKVVGHHQDFYSHIMGHKETWLVKYNGKYYSNWPYTFKVSQFQYLVYINKKLKYTFFRSGYNVSDDGHNGDSYGYTPMPAWGSATTGGSAIIGTAEPTTTTTIISTGIIPTAFMWITVDKAKTTDTVTFLKSKFKFINDSTFIFKQPK